MITNNFNKELRGISDALRDLGYPGYNRYDDETKFLSKDIWARTAETQPFFAFLSIIQNFSLRRLCKALHKRWADTPA